MFYRSGPLALLLLFLPLLVFSQSESGKIRGLVTDQDGAPVPMGTVTLLQGESPISTVFTDFEGYYVFQLVGPGTYDILVQYSGFSKKITKVTSFAGKTIDVSISMNLITESETVEIEGYKNPLFEIDKTSIESVTTKEQINKMQVRSPSDIAAVGGGAYQADRGDAINIRGTRSDANQIFIDGERVIGSSALSMASLEQVSLVKGGTPAQFGDFSGGIINVTTSAPAPQWQIGGEFVTSQVTDAYKYNLAALNASGPIWKDSLGQTKLGIFIAGEYQHEKDRDPSAIDLFQLKPGLLEDLQNTPLQPNTDGTFFVNRANFLGADDFEATKVKTNNSFQAIRLNGRLDFRVGQNAWLKVGASTDMQDLNLWEYRRSLLAPGSQENRLNNTFRTYVRFQQQFIDTAASAFIKSISYQLQFGYTRFDQVRQDGQYKDDYFKYGHVAQFQNQQAEVFEYISPEDPRHRSNLSSNGYWQTVGFADTNYTYVPGTASNPIQENYNRVIYEYLRNNPRQLSFGGQSIFTSNVINRFDLLQLGGLINGFNTSGSASSMNVYSLWDGQGTNFPFYVKRREEMFRLTGQATLSLGKEQKKQHNITVGFEFDQRFERFFSITPGSLWQIMSNLANKHLFDLDTANFQAVYRDGVFQDTVRLNPEYDRPEGPGSFDPEQSNFDRNLRAALGLGYDNTSLVNVDSYGPSTYNLDMFNADELLNGGNSLVTYYGYDFRGNISNQSSSAADFFNNRDQRPISPYAPTYIAGYIQDKFEFNNIIFNIGLRIDRLDLNQSVLKDKFVMRDAYTAGETAQLLGVTLPSNIDPSWQAYVDNVLNPTTIIGYRNGSNWLDATGTPVSSQLLQVNGRVRPHVKVDSLTADAFKDYEPAVNVMPRISFSFPINSRATFFAHYDILTQRPTNAEIGLFTDYLFIAQNANRGIANPALKPQTTIDYEVGFKQGIAPDKSGFPTISLTISAYYRELRNMIQIVRNQNAYPISYDSFENIDFGTVKGFTLELETRRLGIAQLRAAYTLQFASGTGSSFTSSRNALNSVQGFSVLRNELPLSFDQRHTIVGNIDLRFTDDKLGPKIFGIYPLKNFGANLTFNLGSGTPFTYNSLPNQADVQYGVNATVQTKGQPFSNSLPFNYRLDLRVDKDFFITLNNKKVKAAEALKGDEVEFGALTSGAPQAVKPKQLYINLYLLIANLLNTPNVLGVYGYSGQPNTSGFLTSPIATTFIQQQIDPASFVQQYQIKEQKPDNYSQPRTIRLGLLIQF